MLVGGRSMRVRGPLRCPFVRLPVPPVQEVQLHRVDCVLVVGDELSRCRLVAVVRALTGRSDEEHLLFPSVRTAVPVVESERSNAAQLSRFRLVHLRNRLTELGDAPLVFLGQRITMVFRVILTE